MKNILLIGLIFILAVSIASPVLGSEAANLRTKDTKSGVLAHEAAHVVQQARARGGDLDGKGTDNVVEEVELAVETIDRISQRSAGSKGKDQGLAALREFNDKAKSAVYESGGWMKIMKKRAEAQPAQKARHDAAMAAIRNMRSIAQDSNGEGTDNVAKKVVRFKAGSDLAKHVKSAANIPAEKIELAIEELRLAGKITDAEAEKARAIIEERKIIWEHKEQNTESEADWLDK